MDLPPNSRKALAVLRVVREVALTAWVVERIAERIAGGV
jgi:hypothetical protein